MTIVLPDDQFQHEPPTEPGNYPVKKRVSARGYSQEQVVRVFRGTGQGLMCIGPGWLTGVPVESVPFRWGPKIEIPCD